MVNLKEIRIGNFVDCEWNEFSVVLSNKDLEKLMYEQENGDIFSVPISVDLLEKLGFKKRQDFSKSGNMQKTFVSELGTSIFKISLIKKDKIDDIYEIVSFFYNSDNEQKVTVKYIHRLQNLFFEITNVELELI